MKKQLLTFVLSVLAFAGFNAQILTDNIDSYALGAIGPQADHWSTWSGDLGTPEDGIVSDDFAASGANSMYIQEGVLPNGGPQDVILLLGDSTEGGYTLSWNMYIPDDASTGYYNFQGSPTIGADYVIEIYFGSADGSAPGTIFFGGAAAADQGTYPVGEWFEVSHKIDLNTDLLEISIDGEIAYEGLYEGSTLAASSGLSSIDFFTTGPTNRYYIDDINLDWFEACPVADALICDNFESYDNSMFIGPQSSVWTTWTEANEGTIEDGILSQDYANSGTTSMLIEEATGPNGGPQDVILLLGNYTTGRYSIGWNFLIESGASGYYNIQGGLPVGGTFPLSTYMNAQDANAGIGYLTAPPQATDTVGTFTYLEDEWNSVEHIIDLDNDLMHILVNGEIVAINVLYENDLAAIDFFSSDDFNRMYVDDVVLMELDPVVACELGAADILCDNLDTYVGETTAGQWADHWSTWSGDLGTAEDGLISTDYAASGNNSYLIQEGVLPNGGPQDALLLLNDATSGAFDLSWNMYLPGDIETGYYNIQGSPTIGADYVIEVYLGSADGSSPGTIFFGGAAAATQGSYPIAEWFEVSHFIDLDNDVLEISINGVVQYSGVYEGSTLFAESGLSSIDFFTTGPTNRYYVDDILFSNNPVGISEIGSSEFVLYPNPNNGEFNIMNDAETGTYNVSVMDLMGRTVYSEAIRMTEGSVSNIQLGTITTGVYLVNLTNEDSATVKVVKMIVR